ncbi:MAG TPA: hypothetical protein VGO57_14100 [Verrucomicrobiae bacterium]|jgi:hypothetical protein
MNIDDYIVKYDLQPWKKWPDLHHLHDGTPHINFTIGENGEKFPQTDELHIYTNAERTRFVIVNATRNIFKVHHHELIPCSTGWHDCDREFSLQKLE